MFSTTELNGDSTVWVKEGATTIGNVIVDMIDARTTDGFIAIGTHGNGVYSTYFNPSAGFEESQDYQTIQVGNVFPNPVQDEAQVEVIAKETKHLETTLYAYTGKLVKKFPDKTIYPGKQNLSLQFGELPAGAYYLVLKDGKEVFVRKIVIYTGRRSK